MLGMCVMPTIIQSVGSDGSSTIPVALQCLGQCLEAGCADGT